MSSARVIFDFGECTLDLNCSYFQHAQVKRKLNVDFDFATIEKWLLHFNKVGKLNKLTLT